MSVKTSTCNPRLESSIDHNPGYLHTHYSRHSHQLIPTSLALWPHRTALSQPRLTPTIVGLCLNKKLAYPPRIIPISIPCWPLGSFQQMWPTYHLGQHHTGLSSFQQV